MAELWWLNGKYVSPDEARISVMDRGFLFGDGLYEVARIYNNRPFCLKEHLDRFFFGVEGTKMPFNYSRRDFEQLIRQVVADSDLGWGIVYWQVSRGAYIPRTHYITETMTQPTLFIQTREIGPQPKERRELGVKVITHPDLRWMKCCYKTVNLMGNCLAATAARDAGVHETVLYRDENHITECALSSFFIVKNGEVWTHPEGDLILSGITRGEVKKLCQKNGIPIVEKVFGLKDMFAADEAFLSNSLDEVCPVVVVDDKTIGNGRPGPVTQRLSKLFLEHTGQA